MQHGPVSRWQRRHWRIARHSAGVLLLLACLALLAALVVLRNLDTGIVKRRLHSLVANEAGLDLDYASAHADIFSGLALRDVTIASPPAYRALAPTLVRLSRLRLGWSLFGSGPTLRRLVADEVELVVVVDDKGHTSLDSLGGKSPRAPEPAPTPGGRLQALVKSLPDFDRVQLDKVTLTILYLRDGKEASRSTLRGLAIAARSHGEGAARAVEVALGEKSKPLTLDLEHQPSAGARAVARARWWLAAAVDAAKADAHTELAVEHQTLSPAWPAKGVYLGLDASARARGDELAIELAHLDAVAETLTGKGAVLLGPNRARIEHGAGTLDLKRLAKLASAAVPVSLRDGHFKYDLAGLELLPWLRLDAGGRIDVDGRVAELGIHRGPGEAVEIDDARLVLKGKPLPDGGVELAGEGPLGRLKLARDRQRLELAHGETSLKATLSPKAPWLIELRTRAESLALDGGGGALRASRAEIETRLSDLVVDFAKPAAFAGALTIAVTLGALDERAANGTVHLVNARLGVRGRFADGVPESIAIDAPIGTLAVSDARGVVLVPAGPARLTVDADRLRVDRAAPLFSTGHAHAALAAGGVTLGADADKRREAADVKLTLDAPRTALFTAFAPPALALPGARMGLALSSTVHVDNLASVPRVRQHTAAKLTHPAVTLADSTLAASLVDLVLDSDGDLHRQQATLTLAPTALALEDERLGDGKLAATVRYNDAQPSFELTLEGQGDALPRGHLTVKAAWLARERALDYRVDADLAHLAAVEPLLPAALTDAHWLDLSDLSARIEAHGKLAGLLVGFDAHRRPRWAPHPLDTLRGDDELSLRFANVRYVDAAGVELTVPSVTLAGHLKADGQRRQSECDLRIDSATLKARGHRIVVRGVHDHVTGVVDGNPVVAPFEVAHRLEIGTLQQDLLPSYPIGGVVQTTRGRRGSDGAFVVDEFTLANAAAGTKLAMRGTLMFARAVVRAKKGAPPPPLGFTSVAFSLSAEQRLDKLAVASADFRGTGTMTVDADVASGDLHRFHAGARLGFHDVSLSIPSKKIAVAGLDGTLPVVEDLVSRRGVTRILPAEASNAYPQARFSDQHPFLSHAGALAVKHMSFGDLAVDDLAGSLRIARNQLAVDELDAAVRGGRVAGQLKVTLDGAASSAQLRLRLTGIEARHGGARERFDGNAALALTLKDRSVDGRIEILRIGRHHLYDLLDEYDPHHKDASTNRLRTALAVGYPDRAHVMFDRGFANLSVAFGGLGRLVKVNEVRGIPTGPLVERYLGSLGALAAPEAP